MRNGNVNEGEVEDFQSKAKTLVAQESNKIDGSDLITDQEVYVVWFCKTLQNWKALLSTHLPNDRYFEVTYNGDKGETYVDTYVKARNTAVPD